MYVFVVITALALAALLFVTWRIPRAQDPKTYFIINLIGKGVASGAILASLPSLDYYDTVLGQVLYIAIAWSLIGDLLLAMTHLQLTFIFGTLSFLITHLCYIMLLRFRGADLEPTLLTFSILILPAALLWKRVGPRLQGGRRLLIGIYIVVISWMFATAIASSLAVSRPNLWLQLLPALAALCFWLSDLAVARQRFLKDSWYNRAVGLPLYYGSQYLFIWMVTDMAHHILPP